MGDPTPLKISSRINYGKISGFTFPSKVYREVCAPTVSVVASIFGLSLLLLFILIKEDKREIVFLISQPAYAY